MMTPQRVFHKLQELMTTRKLLRGAVLLVRGQGRFEYAGQKR